jgi:putative membrane protein
MNLRDRFTEKDMQRIRDAVKEAESKISGEIVPVIVERSGFYTIANYRGALIASGLSFLAVILLDRYVFTQSSFSLLYDPLFIFFLVMLAGVAGAVLPQWSDTLKRWLLVQVHMDNATKARAENAFLEEEVFATRQRTGIMIFISMFEHEVIVLGDKGINEKVQQREWDQLVNQLTSSIRTGQMIEGIEQAILRCGQILLEKGFHRTDDDVNELRDELRIDR